jgi:hypothetical protein
MVCLCNRCDARLPASALFLLAAAATLSVIAPVDAQCTVADQSASLLNLVPGADAVSGTVTAGTSAFYTVQIGGNGLPLRVEVKSKQLGDNLKVAMMPGKCPDFDLCAAANSCPKTTEQGLKELWVSTKPDAPKDVYAVGVFTPNLVHKGVWYVQVTGKPSLQQAADGEYTISAQIGAKTCRTPSKSDLTGPCKDIVTYETLDVQLEDRDEHAPGVSFNADDPRYPKKCRDSVASLWCQQRYPRCYMDFNGVALKPCQSDCTATQSACNFTDTVWQTSYASKLCDLSPTAPLIASFDPNPPCMGQFNRSSDGGAGALAPSAAVQFWFAAMAMLMAAMLELSVAR